MTKANPKVKSGDYQQMLRERLQQLTERHQQAEIAARTGTPPANVHRYLKAGKIPSEFLAGIVEHFDVDPEWLLTGKGEQASSSVKSETAAKAGELLDLVKTMNAISRMRLGAIVNDKDRKLMRELGDALQTFDRLREKMNQQSRPVMQQLVGEIGIKLASMEIDRARVAAHTAVELSRICLDDELLTELDSQLGNVAYLTGQLEEAVMYDRKVFARRIMKGVIKTPDEIDSCASLVMHLRDSGRCAEARRIGEAVLALVPDPDMPIHSLQMLQMLVGMLQVEEGDVAVGMARCHRIWPRISGRGRVSETVMMLLASTLTGVLGYFEALNFGDKSMGKARLLVRWACLQEDNKMLKHATENLLGEGYELLPPAEYDARRALFIERLLNGRGKKLSLNDFDKLTEEAPPVVASKAIGDMILAVHRGQIARLVGHKKSLSAIVKESIRCIGKVPEDRSIRIGLQIIHLRNMKAITGKAFTGEISELQLELDGRVAGGFYGLCGLL